MKVTSGQDPVICWFRNI